MIRWLQEDRGIYVGHCAVWTCFVREEQDGTAKWWFYERGAKRTDLGAREIDGYPATSAVDALMQASNAVADAMRMR